ncbi:putative Atherin [Streptomyces aurantiacus JA 4570]|uniref:Putative Atherin n=1 Tax=Streptomyces aurantiacus JA 4570 TaxID=1286094 RepID=S3ZX72_9ACTN|nr:putative Atherin [Streptomyces aurantiacus JA 4570]
MSGAGPRQGGLAVRESPNCRAVRRGYAHDGVVRGKLVRVRLLRSGPTPDGFGREGLVRDGWVGGEVTPGGRGRCRPDRRRKCRSRWRPALGRRLRAGVRESRRRWSRRVGSFAHRPCIARRPPRSPVAHIPGAERCTAQPLSGRYTSLVTQGQGRSTLRDCQRQCGHAAHAGGCGACGYRGSPAPRPSARTSSGRR